MRLYTLGWRPCYHWHCRISPVFRYKIQICWIAEGVGIQLQCMGEKGEWLCCICDGDGALTKRSAKGPLTSSSTQAQAQPTKALGCHTLLKEGCPATQAWVHYAWCTVILYWLAQFHHCHLLHLAPLCHNHLHTTAYTVYIIWTFWHHLLQFLTIPHSYTIQLLYAEALASGLT